MLHQKCDLNIKNSYLLYSFTVKHSALNFHFPPPQAYLYIRKKRIAGCLVVGPMLEGFRLLPEQSTDDVGCVGEKVIPVKCGVSRIWTAKKQRKQNVAKNLLQTMR